MKSILLLLLFLIYGCTHPIVISPDLSLIKNNSKIINKKVGYYISSKDRNKEIIDYATSGDKVSYYPYRDLENGIHRVLLEVFKEVNVVDLSLIEDSKNNDYSYIFIPEITTESKNDSNHFWPPTYFQIDLKMKAIGQQNQPIWEKNFQKIGTATSEEWKYNQGMAGNKASAKILKELLDEIASAKVFVD